MCFTSQGRSGKKLGEVRMFQFFTSVTSLIFIAYDCLYTLRAVFIPVGTGHWGISIQFWIIKVHSGSLVCSVHVLGYSQTIFGLSFSHACILSRFSHVQLFTTLYKL